MCERWGRVNDGVNDGVVFTLLVPLKKSVDLFFCVTFLFNPPLLRLVKRWGRSYTFDFCHCISYLKMENMGMFTFPFHWVLRIKGVVEDRRSHAEKITELRK